MSGETNSEPANSGSQPEPVEPLEERIARAVENALEPFVVSLLAALLSPAQCVQGIERESEDQRWKAITLGRTLLNETRENLKAAYPRMEQYNLALATHKQQQIPSPAEDWLYLDMKLGDDTFSKYLRDQGAPSKIRARDAVAHLRALRELEVGGLLIANRAADGDLFGYYIRKVHADEYLKLERKAGSNAMAKSRSKKPAKKNPRK